MMAYINLLDNPFLGNIFPPPRDVHLPILKQILALLKERQEKVLEGGKQGLGILKGIIKDHRKHLTCLTRNMASHYIITYTDVNIAHLVIVTGTDNHAVVSGLLTREQSISNQCIVPKDWNWKIPLSREQQNSLI
jgi:hypothetical protein